MAHQHEVARLTSVDQIAYDLAFIVEFDVGLRDHVLVFFPRREIEGERFKLGRTLFAFFQLGVQLLGFVFLQVVSGFMITIAGVDYGHVVEHAAVLHAAVRRLDEAIVVNPGIATQRRNQSDVRTFRGFNRANAAVVRRVYVADFESRALT